MANELSSDCPRCGGHRVERFTVNRLAVTACADCGAYRTERTAVPWLREVEPDRWEISDRD